MFNTLLLRVNLICNVDGHIYFWHKYSINIVTLIDLYCVLSHQLQHTHQALHPIFQGYYPSTSDCAGQMDTPEPLLLHISGC